jgi:F0F1-type ATP synthase membrane subunit b/b'
MPDIPETADLEALIRALISKANDRLRRQLDDVRQHAEREHNHEQDAFTDAS